MGEGKGRGKEKRGGETYILETMLFISNDRAGLFRVVK